MQEMMKIYEPNRKNRTELSQFGSVTKSNRFGSVLKKLTKTEPNRPMLTPTRSGARSSFWWSPKEIHIWCGFSMDWKVGVSIGRFGSVFANFCKTEPNRLDLATEPNRLSSEFGFSIFSVRPIFFHHFLHFLITIILSSFNILISNIQYPN